MDSIDSLAIEENELPNGKKNEFLIVFLLAFICYLSSLDSMLLMPLGNIIMKTFNVSPVQSTIVVSVYSIVAGISGFFVCVYYGISSTASNCWSLPLSDLSSAQHYADMPLISTCLYCIAASPEFLVALLVRLCCHRQ
jgi:MFS family permease